MFPFQRGSVSSTVAESHKKNRKIRQKNFLGKNTFFCHSYVKPLHGCVLCDAPDILLFCYYKHESMQLVCSWQVLQGYTNVPTCCNTMCFTFLSTFLHLLVLFVFYTIDFGANNNSIVVALYVYLFVCTWIYASHKTATADIFFFAKRLIKPNPPTLDWNMEPLLWHSYATEIYQ